MLACRPFLCFAAAVMAGVLTARFHPGFETCLPFCKALFLILLAAYLFIPARTIERPAGIPEAYAGYIHARPGFLARRGLNRLMLLACAGLFLLGVMRQNAWERRLDPANLPEKRWFNAAFVANEPSRPYAGERGRWRVNATLFLADGSGVGDVPVQVQGSGNVVFRRGDIVHARVRRLSTTPRAYPGAFDFSLLLERSGAVATLEIAWPTRNAAPDAPRLAVLPVDSPPVFTRIRRFVDEVRSRAIRITLERGGSEGGVLAAMLYGYRKDTAAEIRDAFRRVGIGHVLAISGLHVGLIIGLLWWLGGWIGWRRNWRALGCLVLAFFYLGLAGGQVAATRATLMAAIHLVGMFRGRKGDMLNSLGAAAFFITLANPGAPTDVSFQLSFTAVVFIYIALRRTPAAHGEMKSLRNPLFAGSPWQQRVRREIQSLVRLSIATWIGLFPIIALVFNQVNLIGLPINIVVIPLMSLVLAGGLLLPWLGWIPGVSWLLTLPSKLLTAIAMACDAIPGSSFAAHAPSLEWTLIFYLFVALFMLRPLFSPPSFRAWWTTATLAGLTVCCIGLIAGMTSRPAPRDGRIAVLPGRGMGTMIVETPGGGIGILGEIRRGGLNEAEWLHYLRRSGDAALLAVGRPARGAFDALGHHYDVSGTTVLPPTKKDEAGSVAPWTPLPGAEGVEYSYWRDARGRVSWLSARTADKTATIMARSWRRDYGVVLLSGDGAAVYDGKAWRDVELFPQRD
ncbi:MAG: ComEC/Rec2 family competence protein [Planctomycetota bacterium]|jgi:ComEC/Rec2-related protein|nr:ComEC/Rec2 family competence protein [Planctomycetota bacterium]